MKGDKIIGATDPRNFLYFFDVLQNILLLPSRKFKNKRCIPRTGPEDYYLIHLDTCSLIGDKIIGETDP